MKGYKIEKFIVIFMVMNFIGSTLSRMIDEEFSAEEWTKLFPGSGSEALEYEIIPVHSSRIQKRDADQGFNVQIKAFGEHIKLWLNPSDRILAGLETPVFTILPHFNIVSHPHSITDAIEMFYEDLEHAAALSIDESSDGLTELVSNAHGLITVIVFKGLNMNVFDIRNGVINSKNIYVRSIPDKYQKYARRYRRSVDDESELDSGDFKYHIAFKLPEEPEHMKKFEKMFANLSRSKRSLIETIYPEIMVIVDYPLYKLLGADVNKVVAYILTFWSGVDLRYRGIQNPKIRLNIAGIMIALSPDSLPYTNYKSPYKPYDILIDDVLDASGMWLVDLQRYLPTPFDAAVTMTSEHFCEMSEHECRRGSAGVAYAGQICSSTTERYINGKSYLTVLKTAIVHDQGAYRGIHTAAHELGHLLGAKHDGLEYNNCSETSGHMMAPSSVSTSNSSDFSSCTAQYFEKFLNSGNASCLFNKPQISKAFVTFLPGKIETANEQCYRLEGTTAAFIDATTCTKLVCVSKYNRFETRNFAGAADGTRCGEQKICLHTQCIREADIIL